MDHALLMAYRHHGTSALGFFATVTSGSTAVYQDDDAQKAILFFISFAVGLLTIVHLFQQIWLKNREIQERKDK